MIRKFLVLLLLSVSLFVFNASAATVRYTFTLGKNTERSYVVRPGQSISGSVVLRVIDDKNVGFQLEFLNRSGYQYALPGSDSVLDMSTWISFPEGDFVDIDGAEEGVQEAKVPFKITIPSNITPGDYTGSMRAVLVDDGSTQFGSGAGVSLSTAIAIEFKFSVPGERYHRLEFKDFSFLEYMPEEKEGFGSTIVTELKYNSFGNTFLKPYAHYVVTNLWGKVVYDEIRELSDVSPGSNVKKKVSLGGVDPIFLWGKVNVELRYSTVSIDGKVGGDVFNVGTGSFRLYVIPWLEITIFIVLLVIFLFYVFYRRFQINQLMKSSKEYVVAKGETLQDVCEKFDVDPKKVIRVNRLKKPYFLKVGESILIPEKQ